MDKDTARRVREASVSAAIQAAKPNIKLNCERIDKSCAALYQKGIDVSIKSVIEELRMTGAKVPAEQTIRNHSPAGDRYRTIINAWVRFLEDVRAIGKATRFYPLEGDLPDDLLARIEPLEARALVLDLRSNYRSMKNQLNILHQTPRVIQRANGGRFERVADAMERGETGNVGVSARTLNAIEAFLDENELSTRGGAWDVYGQLRDTKGDPLSRPGLRQALIEVIARIKKAGDS